jgi:flagellar hook-associated protein 3 FlgL
MRVTQRSVFDNFMRDVNKNRTEMAQIQSRLSSGYDVRYPSQDPVSFQRSRGISEDVREADQFQNNINSGLRQSRLAQDALDQSLDDLIEVKRILVQGTSDNYDEGDRENMANQIAGIRDSLIATFNLSYGDRYLFAGTNSDQKPFELDAAAVGGVANNSNTTPLSIYAEAGVAIDISVTGTEIRDTESGDLFEVISTIEQALRDNDSATLNALIPASDDLINNVTDATARLGNNINRMDFMFEQYESSKITQKAEISKLIDTDFAQAISDLQKNEVAYKSAMAVHTRMFNNTLLNYL